MKSAGLARYYLGHEQGAYYFDSIWQQGRWVGGAVIAFGLPEEVRRDEFQHLLDGFSPDGHRALVQNAGHPNRDAAWDLTFSAPKSVSVLWSMSPPEVRREIEAEHWHAVEKSLASIEQTAGLSRRGKGGAIKEPAALLFATFFHGASRAQNPAIHTHAVMPNVGLRHDGTTAALWTKEIFRRKMAAGAAYREALAAGLTQRLHLTLEPDKVGFHIRGVPRDLCEASSERRRTILRVMSERGLHGAVAAKMVTLLTRPKKRHLPEKEFLARCHEIGRQFGWDCEKARQLVEQARTEWLSAQAVKSQPRETGYEPARAEPQSEKHSQATAGAEKNSRSDRKQPAATPTYRSEEQNPKPGNDRESRLRPGELSQPTTPREAGADSGIWPGRAAQKTTSDPGDGRKAQAIKGEEIRGKVGSEQTTRRAHTGATEANREKIRLRPGPEPRPGFRQPESHGRFRTDPGGVASGTTSQPRAVGGGDLPGKQGLGRHQSEQNLSRKASTPAAPEDRHQFRFQWRPLFPKAPFWSLARFAKVPAISFPDPKSGWGAVRSERSLWLAKLRIQNRRLFPNAPKFNPLHKLEIPVPRLTSFPWSRDQKRPAKWWTMKWKHSTRLGEFRIQARHPFRDAPGWNPLQGLEIPALRFTSKRSNWTRVKADHIEKKAQVQRSH